MIYTFKRQGHLNNQNKGTPKIDEKIDRDMKY